MFKCPPTCHARELSAAKPVHFTMCCNRGKEIEKIENDLGTRLVLDAEWDKSREGIAGQIRIYADSYKRLIYKVYIETVRSYLTRQL